MFLNTKLQSREKPIKVAFIGCGKFVSMFLAQYNQLQKITIDTIVDINKDLSISLGDVELNLPKEVVKARQYQYDLIN